MSNTNQEQIQNGRTESECKNRFRVSFFFPEESRRKEILYMFTRAYIEIVLQEHYKLNNNQAKIQQKIIIASVQSNQNSIQTRR